MTRLRAIIVTSDPAGNAARVTEALLRSAPEIVVAGAVIDTGSAADRRRQIRRLRAWMRHGGPRYALWRVWLLGRDQMLPSPPQPRWRHSLYDMGEQCGFPVIDVPNVNHRATRDALRTLAPDLGISLGNRMIERATFSIPRLGMINLHHGRIPDYRGGPPAFWELVHGEPALGVSVHRIDDRLDHGELLARAEVPVRPDDRPRTLMARARSVDHAVVVQAVRSIAAGTAPQIGVDLTSSHARTLPSRAELQRLQRRLGGSLRHDDFRWAELPDLPHQSR